MFRPQLNINIHSIFKNMDSLFANNISSHSVSVSTVIENGIKKTRKVTTENGVKKVEEYEEPYEGGRHTLL